MLFSDDHVAALINNRFEAAWESVRPVPLVTINFGNGHVLTRTLNGNIATYVCTADGKMLDVLPGVYEPTTYLDRLDQFGKLHRWIKQDAPQAATKLARYHREQAKALANHQPRLVFGDMKFQTKKHIENSLKLVLLPGAKQEPQADGDIKGAGGAEAANFKTREDLARWNILAKDTAINESIRREAIHRYLVDRSLKFDSDNPALLMPHNVTKWLYREVLNADIDDPYLGLGKVLFASYPFKDAT